MTDNKYRMPEPAACHPRPVYEGDPFRMQTGPTPHTLGPWRAIYPGDRVNSILPDGRMVWVRMST